MIPISERKTWLQWIVDLIQTDLESLPKRQKEQLLFEASYFCGEHFDSLDFWAYEEGASPESGKDYDLNKLQAVFRGWLNKIESIVAKQGDLELPSKSFLRSFKYPYPLPGPRKRKSLQADFFNISAVSEPIDPDDYKQTWKSTFEIINEPINRDDYTNWAIMNFIKLIDGVGTDPVRKCKGCNRYFVNLTQREKIYCTPSCASRSIVKENRDELKEKYPEKYRAYLDKQNRYSKKRYERKRKEQLGPNVKISRRRKRVETSVR